MSGSILQNITALSHAYIIVSQDVEAREKAALELSCAFVCQNQQQKPCMECRQCRMVQQGIHPDIIFIDRLTDDKGKLKKELQVDQIRHMAADAWVRPQQAAKKVYVLREAGLMNVTAQNAALKILEEPPAFCGFILCAGSSQELLATVRSRCVILQLHGESRPCENAQADEYISLAAKKDAAGLCSFCAGCESMDSSSFGVLLESIGVLLGETACGRHPNPGLSSAKLRQLLELQEKAAEYLKMNVGVKHILGMLCALTI